MKGRLLQALEKEREFYVKKLLLFERYDLCILGEMTTRELKEEYIYYYKKG